MKIFLAGGTGVIGRRLIPLLVDAGHDVTVMTRSVRGEGDVRGLGAQPVSADALDADAVRQAVLRTGPDVVINQLTNIPPRLDPRRVREQMAATNRLRIGATHTLLEAARAAGSHRFISQSISFVYVPNGAAPATEDEPLYVGAPAAFNDLVHAVAVSERTVLEAENVHGMVLRYGYFYGPGTVYAADGGFVEDVRRRRVPIVGNGQGVCSFIHVDDAAAATCRALEHGEPGAYNIVDDEPAPVSVWLRFLAELLAAPRPRRVPRLLGRLGAGPYGLYYMTRQRGASNRKAKERLGWTPSHPGWRDGFTSELGRLTPPAR